MIGGSRATVIIMALAATLKLWGHGAIWITQTIAQIGVGAVTAGYRISATPIPIPASPRSLILRGDHAVRITAAIDIDIMAVSAVLNWAQQGTLARQG